MSTKERMLTPPENYQKKIENPSDSYPLSETFTSIQVEKRIAFYQELNEKRREIKEASLGSPELVRKSFALYGHDQTTTVRVYMRETVTRIAAELFSSDYSISVENTNHRIKDQIDKDHGHVVVSVQATAREIDALLNYIHPGASFYVYDGEKSKYTPGDTSSSEFIVTKVDDHLQPQKYWRRSQSFIASVTELS